MPNPSLERTSNGWPLFVLHDATHRPSLRPPFMGKSREKKSDGGIALILSPVFAGHLRIQSAKDPRGLFSHAQTCNS